MNALFERQWIQLAGLAVLLPLTGWIASHDSLLVGECWGLKSVQWLWLAVALAIAQQVWVAFWWRAQLHRKWPSRILGAVSFVIYGTGFTILGLSRLVLVWILAVSNAGSLALPGSILRFTAILLALPTLYLFYSVGRYFGFKRGLGHDHWDASFRNRPLVRQGIFRFTSNAMYTFGLLILWIPALWFGSVAALWAACFNHLYIWIHYLATERPDMLRIYGAENSRQC